MTAATLETTSSTGPRAPRADEVNHIGLGVATEALARLRFAVLLTARWEAAETDDAERRKELLAELTDLRRLYHDKVDEIAMSFGVAEAMKSQAEVERAVALQPEPRSPEPARIDDGLYF
ncbi:MAG: hypothetical protein ACRD3N_07050 [Terracidiphilus sp.]